MSRKHAKCRPIGYSEAAKDSIHCEESAALIVSHPSIVSLSRASQLMIIRYC